ncbi:DUF3871 family protein [Formosa sp. PL04]|uniref:DUF3871 family protein n=1 Tax=Formosa sp. PL04 TaxID=3081755 RepID=UPI0029815D86|nr:DUF3871 family protein [Formosa sp. PL04]MDW5289451.1 DUF3871 family protein [Formosa sp. PL04]
MDLVLNNNSSHVIEDVVVMKANNKSGFIEANTESVTLNHLRDECIIPVFSKDNESTISHFQFVDQTFQAVKSSFPGIKVNMPDIRVSHVIKGRIPSAIGKPAKELLDNEKTIYYERCAFLINIPDITSTVSGNKLTLSVGGVRSLNQENLYSRKSVEKFKIFIGYTNKVCTNLCVSTDGLCDDIRISSISELDERMEKLFNGYDFKQHLEELNQMQNYVLNESQFAHLIGKIRMFQSMPKSEQHNIFKFNMNDSQITKMVKEYYNCPNFKRAENGSIDMWRVYNLLTEANKSSYIDNYLERSLCAFKFTRDLCNSLENERSNWFLNN